MMVVITYAKAFALYDVETTDRLKVWAVFPEPIIADGSTVNYITVYQHDDDDLDYTAFNMEFILPEGFRVNKIKQGRETVNDIQFSARATSTHAISCNLVGGVDLRIIGDSSENADLYKDDEDGNLIDELFTVGLIAETSLKSGNYEVRMEGIKFCHKNADARIPAEDPKYYTITVNNTVTGIDEVSWEELEDADCYDLEGRKIDPRGQHGIIVLSKGKKYLIK